MVEFYVIEIYVLLTMAILMFIMSIGVLYLGHKKGTPNYILWALFMFSWGLHWLSESMADYYEEVLDIELLLFSQLELFTAFISSFILLAACLEYNGMLRRHLGKIIALVSSILPLYFIMTINEDTLEEIEEIYIMRGEYVSTELFRFLYGFILPLISIIALFCTYLYYYHQSKKGKIFYKPKMLKTTMILAILIFIFSIFNGFDYCEEQEIEVIFISLRAISLAFFIVIPLVVVFTFDLGLQKFLIIEHSGIPLLIYSFETKSDVSDEKSFLTSGFLTAIMGFSSELTHQESGFLSIQANYLYYIIRKTGTKIYALQSISKNKYLENQFFQVAKEIDTEIGNISKASDINQIHMKQIIDNNFSTFY
ncbi:MAG: hypothetical protein EU532_06280 [Promethearchaeota archaeon]|nr:MAG: hypothetical protein EU532_06280 [Candidatus Lokiarchaeota archaeon]